MRSPDQQTTLYRRLRPFLPLILVAAAFIVRFAYLSGMQDLVVFDHPHMDEQYHLELARQINSPGGLPAEPFFRAPLYPYLFAFLYKVTGQSLYACRLIGIIIGSFLPLLLFALGRRFFDERVALVAAVAAVAYPLFLYYDASLLITSLMTVLTTLLLWQLHRCEQELHLRHFVVAGVLLGLAGLARPNILLFGPGLALWAWLIIRPRLGLKPTVLRYAAMGCMCLVVILPVTFRNYMVSGDPVFIAWQGGFNFFLGNNRLASGWSATAPGIDFSWQGGYTESIQIAESAKGRTLSRSEVSDFWFDRAFEEIRQDPGHFMSLMVRKLRLTFNGYEIPNNQNIYIARDYVPFIRTLLIPSGVYIPFGLVAPLALVGLLWSLRRWRRFLLLYLLIGSYLITLLLFFVCARFRQPFMPVLLLFAGYAIWQIADLVRTRDYRTLGVVLVGLLLLGFESNHDMLKRDPERVKAEDQFMIGTAYLDMHNLNDAQKHFEIARGLDSTYAPIYSNLGVIAARQKRTTIAAEYFLRAMTMEPTSLEHYLNYANTQITLNRPEKALEVLKRAYRLKPYSEDVLLRLADIHARLGNRDEAIRFARACLQQDPANEQARRVLQAADRMAP